MTTKFRYIDGKIVDTSSKPRPAERPEAVSHNIGFGQHMLAQFEADRVEHGHSDIEFKPDPDVPQFYNVHGGSKKALERYVNHRGAENVTSSCGNFLTEADLRQAEGLARR